MKYTSPIKFNNSLLSNPKTKRVGKKLFWSLFCPVLMIIIAIIMSNANGVGLFIIGDSFDNFSNIMIMGRTILMTLIAALALNTNLNSGRMDFSLGATGILACLLASLIVPGVDTVEHIFQFLLWSVLFGMILGFIHSLVLISTNIEYLFGKLILDGGTIMVDFGTKLKDLRKQAGMTQQQLASQLGITKSVVSYYELSERVPSPEVLRSIALIFHVSTDYLLGIERSRTIDVSDLGEDDIKLCFAADKFAGLNSKECGNKSA